MEASLSPSGAARLHRLEILHTRQAAALVAIERELNKMRVRAQSTARDIQPALRQVVTIIHLFLGRAMTEIKGHHHSTTPMLISSGEGKKILVLSKI